MPLSKRSCSWLFRPLSDLRPSRLLRCVKESCFFKGGAFALEFPSQLLFRRQVQVILHRKEIALVLVQRIADHRLVTIRTKDNADWWIVTGIHPLAFVVVLVELHLPKVFGRDLADLQIDQEEATRKDSRPI